MDLRLFFDNKLHHLLKYLMNLKYLMILKIH